MKGLPERGATSKFPGGSSTDSTCKNPAFVESDRKTDHTKSSKASAWSSLFAPTFSVFEAFTHSSSGDKSKVHSSRSHGHGWKATVRRAVASGPMWRLQERILGSSKTGLSSSTSEIWLLGVCYRVTPEESSSNSIVGDGLATFSQDFSSRIWVTYRKGFGAISDSKFTSDVNWGCMLRSSQMLVAQALIVHHLGRSWRKPMQKPFDKEYIEILHLFGDSEASAFSIHNLLQAGRIYGLAPGSWVGPYATCRAWETLVRAKREQINPLDNIIRPMPMALYVVSGDEDGERGGAPVVSIQDACRLCSDFSNDQASWAPLLLLVPLVLGLDKVNPRYIPSLQSTFTFPQSLGILGGKPGASTYIVGVQDDKAIYLDPHEVQQVADVTRNNLGADTSSYHCDVIRHLALDTIDPSLAIGFYCRDKGDFDDFCFRAGELANQSNGAPLFTIAESQPIHENVVEVGLDGEGDAFDENDCEDHPCEDEWQIL